jgi:hypothetical protein
MLVAKGSGGGEDFLDYVKSLFLDEIEQILGSFNSQSYITLTYSQISIFVMLFRKGKCSIT